MNVARLWEKYTQIRETDWIAAAKGFVEKVAQTIGDQVTIAGFVVLFSTLLFLLMIGVGVLRAVAYLLQITYGHEEIVVREEVEDVKSQVPVFQNINIDAVIAGGLLGALERSDCGCCCC
ncbi:hypothetical protein QBC36DRAFT_329891 [Triangularia setosa]|uniref:Uncharacterized protein n=1 Tax=Triangularia setosa TaxID=2587417 RepID=A0AAN6W6H3_9PEZI|nr:hypothetical protein QBC36DRAFT_329891 [Podospora setosa]